MNDDEKKNYPFVRSITFANTSMLFECILQELWHLEGNGQRHKVLNQNKNLPFACTMAHQLNASVLY